MVHGCPRNLIFMTANKSRPAKSQVGFFMQCRQSPGSNGICMLISSLKRQLLREKRRAQKKGQLSAESCRQTVTVPWTASLRVNIIPNNKHHPAGGVYYLVDLRRFELPTPTMRMWCAPSCATSPCFMRIIIFPAIRFVKEKRITGNLWLYFLPCSFLT